MEDLLTNVRYRKEWSNYTPVSYTVTTGRAGASISVNQSKTFGTSISGDVKGINIGAQASISSGVGYTLNVPPRRSAYVGFRVLEYCTKWKVELELLDFTTVENLAEIHIL